jgi:ammonium transporter, Amt family
LIIEWTKEKKPKFVGLLTGAVAGLATITPAAAYVSPVSACIIGFLAGLICYYAVALKNKLKWDDALDVWGVHGVGGILGVVALGIFASTAVNSAGANGLLNGNATFFFKEVIAVIGASIYAFLFTYGMLWVINKFTPVKVNNKEEEEGLDEVLHGENAYEI